MSSEVDSMSEVIYINSQPSRWHGNADLCKDYSINKSYNTLDDIGWGMKESDYPYYWGTPYPQYYQASTLFVRKHNGKMDYGHYNDDRPFATIKLLNDVDAEYNFKNFDWIQIVLHDSGPTKHMLDNIKIPVFSTAYYNYEFEQHEVDLGVYNQREFLPDVKQLTNSEYYNRGLLVNNTLSILPTCAYSDFLGVNFNNLTKYKREYAKHNKGLQQKVGWRGSLNCDQRRSLVKLSQKYPDLIDAKHWIKHQSPEKDISPEFTYSEYVTFEDQVKDFDYLIEVGAGGFSGRVPHLIQTNRIIFSTDHPVWSYAEHQLIPDKHYIKIKKDLSDLVEKINDVNNNLYKFESVRNEMYKLSESHFTIENIRRVVYDTISIRLNLL